jgi:hypothetical protein
VKPASTVVLWVAELFFSAKSGSVAVTFIVFAIVPAAVGVATTVT